MRRGRYVIERHKIANAGESNALSIDIVNDPRQGLGVPAKSLVIINHGGGAGRSLLHFSITDDGVLWDTSSTISPGMAEEYSVLDNIVVAMVRIWSDSPGTTFSLRATPGQWTYEELKEYIRTERPSDEIKERLLKEVSEGV